MGEAFRVVENFVDISGELKRNASPKSVKQLSAISSDVGALLFLLLLGLLDTEITSFIYNFATMVEIEFFTCKK